MDLRPICGQSFQSISCSGVSLSKIGEIFKLHFCCPDMSLSHIVILGVGSIRPVTGEDQGLVRVKVALTWDR